MALSGFLFDLDGTLIDSNAVHLSAWEAALERHGYRVGRDRIALEMGKGGDQLVPDVLGHEAEARDGEALRATQSAEFEKRAIADGIPIAPGARELIAELRRRGLRTALATSSGVAQLDVAERASGVPWRELFDVVIGADDVKASKPAPDLVEVALAKLELTAAECALLGDTPWDAQASLRAGVVMLGVTRGGSSASGLKRAGARRVYHGPLQILVELDAALRVASPGSARFDRALLETLMSAALTVAEEGMAAGEVPIGCVIARGDGSIVAHGRNRYNETRDRSRHAELDAFAAAAGKLDPESRDTILVSTLEPCVMCTGAAMETAVDLVLYGLRAPADSGTMRVTPPESDESQMPRIVGPILASKSRALFSRWLEKPARNPQQEPYVQQLLRLV